MKVGMNEYNELFYATAKVVNKWCFTKFVQTINVPSQDLGMEFGIEKECYVSAQVIEWKENGTIVKSVGIEMPDGKVTNSLQEGKRYKYLGILAADRFLGEAMKSF